MPSPLRHRIIDTHFHIIDSRFPLMSNPGCLPPGSAMDLVADAPGDAPVNRVFHANTVAFYRPRPTV